MYWFLSPESVPLCAHLTHIRPKTSQTVLLAIWIWVFKGNIFRYLFNHKHDWKIFWNCCTICVHKEIFTCLQLLTRWATLAEVSTTGLSGFSRTRRVCTEWDHNFPRAAFLPPSLPADTRLFVTWTNFKHRCYVMLMTILRKKLFPVVRCQQNQDPKIFSNT